MRNLRQLGSRASLVYGRRLLPRMVAAADPLTRLLGVHVMPRSFEDPVPDVRHLDEEFWTRRSEMVGIHLDLQGQLGLLKDFADRFGDEFAGFGYEHPADPRRFYLGNGSFSPTDSMILYCMLRDQQPNLMIEVGSGFSTLLAAHAMAVNSAEGRGGELIAVEPYPRRFLRQAIDAGLPGLTGLVNTMVQDVPMSMFERLGDGDILFIDSTHVLKTGSDVQYLFLEVVPRLRPGVLVHVHDIYLPYEYPRRWVERFRRYYTEQYLLQAFLTGNRDWETLWGTNLVRTTHGDELSAAVPNYRAGGGSWWMRRSA